MNRPKPLSAETLIYGFESPWPFLLLKQFEVSNNTWCKTKIHITAFVFQQQKQRHSHQSLGAPGNPVPWKSGEKVGKQKGLSIIIFLFAHLWWPQSTWRHVQVKSISPEQIYAISSVEPAWQPKSSRHFHMDMVYTVSSAGRYNKKINNFHASLLQHCFGYPLACFLSVPFLLRDSANKACTST